MKVRKQAQLAITKAMESLPGRFKKSELARRLGTSRPYVSNLLKGQDNLTVDQLSRVLAVCGFDLVLKIKRRK